MEATSKNDAEVEGSMTRAESFDMEFGPNARRESEPTDDEVLVTPTRGERLVSWVKSRFRRGPQNVTPNE